MLAQSIEEVRQEGIEQGIEQGMGKGMHEEQIEVARRMILKGYSINEISELTELSASEIKKLKE